MLRLPMNRPCIENRTPDMSANFYLSSALSLHAGLDGSTGNLTLERRSTPTSTLKKPRCAVAPNVRRLPRTLLEAAEALDCSSFVRNAFGDEFVDISSIKRSKSGIHSSIRFRSASEKGA